MRFAALQGSGTGDYIRAGKSGSAAVANNFAVQRKYGPEYDEIAKTGMKARSAEKIKAMETGAQVTKAGIKALDKVVQTQIREQGEQEVRNIKTKGRKAGAIAGIGMIAGGAYLASRDNTKGRKRPSNTDALRKLFSDYRDSRDSVIEDRESSRTTFDAPEYKPGSNSTGSNSTGANGQSGGSAGKVTSGGEGWERWSRLIRAGEGTSGDSGYNTMFTGAQFSDTSRHPRQINRSNGLASDAAGAYQFLSTTWDGAKNALNLPDFSPESQEKAGKYLAQKRGLAVDTVFTDKNAFLKELDKIAPEWASMPTLATGTSYYGQGGLSPDEAWRIYNGG